MCIETPNLSISVVSESMPHLRRGAMRDFINIMKMTNRYVDSHWNKTNSVYEFSNGSFIEFFSVDDDSKLRGARRNILYVNEANNINEEAYTQLAMRTDLDIYLDYNPTNTFWINNVIKSEEAEVLVLTYKDNEALSLSVINFLESKREMAKTSDYWKNWCKVYLDGLTGSLEGTIFNNWTEIDSIPTEAALLGYGMDFGFTNDPTTCIALYKYDGKIILDEIIYGKGLSNSDISTQLKQEEVKGEIYADSAEPKSIDEIKKYGHKIYPTKKGPDSILHGIQLLQEQEMFITKRSFNLKRELSLYSWKRDSDNNALNIPIDSFNHTIDAARYIALIKLGKKRQHVEVENYFEERDSMSY